MYNNEVVVTADGFEVVVTDWLLAASCLCCVGVFSSSSGWVWVLLLVSFQTVGAESLNPEML